MRHSELLSRALQRSRRVGDMLLQREDQELAQIEALAEELAQREYTPPSREKPCGEHAAACLACYQQHPEEPTRCHTAVEAYAACARTAAAGIVAGGS